MAERTFLHNMTEELQRRAPTEKHEIEYRSECLAQWAMRCGNWPEAIKHLVEMSAQAI